MSNYIVVGWSRAIVMAILQTIRSFSDGRCFVLGDERTEPLGRSALCERHVRVRFDGGDDDGFVGAVASLVAQAPGAILIPADCDAARIVNRVRARLALPITPVPETEILDTFDDKWRFSEFCAQRGLPVPPARLVQTKAEIDFDAVASEFGLPFVVKPINQSGSLGVVIVASREQYQRVIGGNDGYRFHPLLVQRYIDGCDIDLSLLARHGRLAAFAIQQAVGSEIRFVPNAQLESVAQQICALAGYHGLMHIDARLEKESGKVYLIESNPRFWVSLTAAVWCGLDFVSECIEPSAAGVLRLTEGVASLRPPMLCPASWPVLLSDSGRRGRLLRAATFDWYSVGKLLQDLPVMFERLVKRLERSRGAGKAAA